MAGFLPLLLTLAVTTPPTAQAPVLPDLPTLIQQVRANQRQLDKTRESYTFREIQVLHELDKHGNVKKEESREYNVFFVHGHQIERLQRRNGAALSAGDEAKETDHIKHKIELAEQTPPGEPLNNKHQVDISRLLTIEHFSNEHRMVMDNRPMISIDFTGDTKVQTHGIAEDASKHLTGTLWIDEQDRQVRRVQAKLDSPLHFEMGLLSLTQGSEFSFDQKLINNEVWLPTGASAHIEAKAALFLGYHLQIAITDDQYRRFQTSAEQQDGAAPKP